MCVVSSCGGHLTEIRCLREIYGQYSHFYIINDDARLPADMVGRTYFIVHSERDWKTLFNFVEAYRVLKKERPDVMVSTGAGPAVPVALVGRLLFGLRVVFVETITRVEKPSLTGRIMYWVAHEFFYQWKSLGVYFPKGRHIGTLL